MVLLGGLEERKKENSGSGIPLLSRIPVLKWIFGKRTKKVENKKLHIFIRPHVTY
jgi:type IV pilus assembly protein PilQ